MKDETFINKAGIAELNSLHGMVAKELAKGLDDPKVLTMAIKFLKDNDITADVIESNEVKSLTQQIKEIADGESKTKELSVEDMLATAEV